VSIVKRVTAEDWGGVPENNHPLQVKLRDDAHKKTQLFIFIKKIKFQ
jgi:hypothetical protein